MGGLGIDADQLFCGDFLYFSEYHAFMSHPERVYSRGQLLDRIWGSNVYVEERTVDVHIRRLRKVLEPHGHDALIQTVRGAGCIKPTRV